MNNKKMCGYLMTGAVTALAYAAIRSAWGAGGPVMVIAADALTVPGVLFSGIGGIAKISGSGTFDMLGYGLRTFLGVFYARQNNSTYVEYVRERHSDKAKGGELLCAGLIYLSAAIGVCVFCL